MRQRVEEILARHTGRPREQIRKDIERDVYMALAGASAYGLVDGVLVNHRPKTGKTEEAQAEAK